MAEIIVSLSDKSVFGEFDAQNQPEAVVIEKVKKLFPFLPQPLTVRLQGDSVIISFKPVSPSKKIESKTNFQKAGAFASRGNYQQAVESYKRAIGLDPTWAEPRRELAMVYSETNRVSDAIDQLIDALRLDPNDAWSHVILANLYISKKNDLQNGEKFLKRAIEISPNDNWALNSLAYVYEKRSCLPEAKELYEKSISLNPEFPNSYLGLANIYSSLNEYENQEEVLHRFFSKAKSQDSRSKVVFDQGYRIYADLQIKIADRNASKSYLSMIAYKEAIEVKTGKEVKVEQTVLKNGVVAKMQMAWKHERPHHLILTNKGYPQDLLSHLEIHELMHLEMEYSARVIGKNKFFVTDTKTNRLAKNSLRTELNDLRQRGLNDSEISNLLDATIPELCGFLYNCPLDMLIEQRIKLQFKDLKASQFCSIRKLMLEAIQSLSNKDVIDVMPSRITKSAFAMNGTLALFYDRLFNYTTNYREFFLNSSAFGTSERLLAHFDTKSVDLQPGDEYGLIDDFAGILGLNDWYELIDGNNEIVIHTDDDSDDVRPTCTNVELLHQKQPASVLYFLDVFKTYGILGKEKIKQIALEIAVLGMSGIDYASADKKYKLNSLPNKSFSGLELMCYMYAGFKMFAPDHDVNPELDEPYGIALALFHAGGLG